MAPKRSTPKKKDAGATPADTIGKLEPRTITKELEESYLDYAMSVIVSRALPDVRDGLKPVHRRILYAMWQVGMRAGTKFRKSATVVGEVLGKYHPHSDTAVYDTLVRLAQDFSMRYPLVEGQGNFGSVDGDEAAAMRYTESRLMRVADELLTDLDKETVRFRPNYDGSHKEPAILPANLPNLLVNGAVGIAVGMATNIPPHNLTEICDATIHLANHPNANVDALLEYVKGPDFPTGGIIYNKADIRQAYATGKGSIVTRGQAEIEEKNNGEFDIIVSSIPYQVNKAQLIEKMATLVRDKKIEGVKDIRDESDKAGMRVVIELKKESYPRKVLNRLYTHTQLQETFHVNMIALTDNGLQPQVLSLKTALVEYLEHRTTVIKRRTEYELKRAEERAHILEGLKKALGNLDAVIKLIKASQDREDARVKLMKRFKFTERQANAILDMRLHQLANLERKKILDELKELLQKIKEYKAILASPKKILGLVTEELTAVRERYGDERRTEVVSSAVDSFKQEDLIPDEPTIITMTHDGYIKRTDPKLYKTQGRGGKGVIGLTTKEKDQVEDFFSTTTHADLLFFTTQGRVFQMKAYDLPAASRTAKGQAIVNFLQLTGEEKVTAILSRTELPDNGYLVMVTKGGVAKRVKLSEFASVRRSGLIAIRLRKNDTLEWVKMTEGKHDIVLVTANGQAIRFPEKQLRAMGRNASGVRGIRLKSSDTLVGVGVIPPSVKGGTLLVATEKGFGKRSPLSSYRVQGRGGSGIKTAKVTPKTGPIAVAHVIDPAAETEDLIAISQKGQVIRTKLASISELSRATQGVRIMRFSESGDAIASATLL